MRIKKIAVSYVMRFLCPRLIPHPFIYSTSNSLDDFHDDDDDNDCTQIEDKGMKEFHIIFCVLSHKYM